MPIYFVYIIECEDNKGKKTYYTGFTKDIFKRFEQHQKGMGAKYTKGRKLKLVYFEKYFTYSESRKREIEIKELSVEEKKNLIINFEKKKNNKENNFG